MSRPKTLYDPDGLELIRTWVMSESPVEDEDEPGEAVRHWFIPTKLLKEIQTTMEPTASRSCRIIRLSFRSSHG